MISHKEADVIIIGAGPTGLMAAILLQKCGISFRILDKTAQRAHESRALILHARSLELLQKIGLVEEFISAGLIALGVQFFINGHKKAEINLNDIGTDDSPYAFILMLSQSEIERLLVTELKREDIAIEYNMEVIHLQQDLDCVTVTIKDNLERVQNVRTKYVIGADGAHSIVRHAAGLNFEGDAYPQNFLLADCQLEWPYEYSFAKIFLSKTSLAMYMPLKGSALSRVMAIKKTGSLQDDIALTTSMPLTLPEIELEFQKAVGVPIKLSNPVWLSRYKIHHRGVNTYQVGRMLLAGDAAHIHSPAGGQGLNTGLQDVANLIWKLALTIKNQSTNKLIASYHSERWPIGQKLLHFTDVLFGWMASQKIWFAAIRNIILPFIIRTATRFRSCRYRAFRFVSQLGIHYHDNEFLCHDVVELKAVKNLVGHRAPNGLIKRNQDIFDLIQGYQFHVLALSKKPLLADEINKFLAELEQLPNNIGLPLSSYLITLSLSHKMPKVIQAESNQVFKKYGLNDKNPYGLFLIRPDGYIAYQADKLKLGNLNKFLEKLQQ
jgi:2-polyprenyl-6-methoxyphenol hydroxylase-like FAD-dependent oxidoreductase